jgi:hypothetical protein
MIGLAGICILILGLQSDAAKILKRKQVSQFQGFNVSKTSASELLADQGPPELQTTLRPPTLRREAKGKADSQQLDFQRSLV